MSPDTILELSNLSVARPDDETPTLEHVQWHVHTGEWWVVAGSHGSGKSLFLQTLAGLIPPAAGEIVIFGERLAAGERRASGWHRQVGLVFEGGGRLLRSLSVAENIALPIAYHQNCPPAVALESILPIVEALELDRLAAAPAGRIGRSWAQRVALARALALRPDLLLLDDPLAGMDPYHLRWWQQFLPELVRGHPVRDGRPVTLVVTADSFPLWLASGRQFASIQNRQWTVLGDYEQLRTESTAERTEWRQPD